MPDIFALLDELQTIARNGLTYARDPYDLERYERLLAVASESYSALLDMPTESVQERFRAELGYITPKVGGDAALFDETGRVLLVRRADNGRWCLPCGWVEPNESPAEAAVRETKEETGLEVEVAELVDVFTRKPSAAHGPHTMVAVVYLCRLVGGTLRGSHESLELGYWSIDDVPVWAGLHERYARAAFDLWQAHQHPQTL